MSEKFDKAFDAYKERQRRPKGLLWWALLIILTGAAMTVTAGMMYVLQHPIQ